MPTCVFLEREVYAFLSTFDKRGERVRGAMPRARIFFVYGRAAGAGDGPAADGLRSSRCEELAGKAAQEMRGEREEGYFSFSQEKIEGCLLVLQVEAEIGSQLLRP